MKMNTFYSDEGEVLEMTMNEFCEEFNLSATERKRLYKDAGWKDSEGANWCVNKEPKFKQNQLSKDDQAMLNRIELSYIQHLKLGKLEFCEELRVGIRIYKKMYFLWDNHLMTNLIEIEKGEELKFNEAWVPWHLRAKQDDEKYREQLSNYKDRMKREMSAS